MSRLLTLTIVDFKRIKAARIEVKNGINKVVGANGAGKSSVLDALCSLLSGREIPEQPIREGAEFAEIVGETDALWIKRRITKSGSTLVIENKDKTAKFGKAQDLLDKLTGGTGARLFDPSRFIRESDTPEGRKAQANQLRQLVGLDFTELDQKRAALFSARTAANSVATDAEAYANGLPAYPDARAEEQSAGAILSEIDKAQAHNQSLEAHARTILEATNAVTDRVKKVSEADKAVSDARQALLLAENRLRQAKMAQMEAEESLTAAQEKTKALTPTVDTAPLRAKLSTLEADNAKVRANTAKKAAHAVALEKRAKANAMTKDLEAIDAEKAKAMKEAQFPIEGLSFDETGVRYQGKPFTQASDAEKLRVAVAIYAARKPELKVMVLRLGSLLDNASLEVLAEVAEKWDLQILLEIVAADKDDYPDGAIVIENGEVKP